MKDNVKKRALLFLVLNFSVLSVSLVYNFLFTKGLVGRCVFLSSFGFYCPGCGGSRSLNALLNFNFWKSFIYYPPILITSLILLYVDARLFLSIVKRDENTVKFNYRLFLIIPISVILQFIIKNLLLLFEIDILGNVL